MKRLFTLICLIALPAMMMAQTQTIAKWTFPSGELTDTIAEEANQHNLNAYICTTGGTGAIQMKNGATTKAAQADGWDSGMNLKAWQIVIKTTDYESITLSSKQQSGNTDPGPRDFKLQYRTGATDDWTDIENGALTVLNDWTTSEVIELPLPADCYNQELLYIRWVLTSNLDVSGNTLEPAGKTKIDDIIVKGELITGMDENAGEDFRIFPNPCQKSLVIEQLESNSLIEIIHVNGQVVHQQNSQSLVEKLNLDLPKGLYLVRITSAKNNQVQIKKLIMN